jgi:hypothetical protein
MFNYHQFKISVSLILVFEMPLHLSFQNDHPWFLQNTLTSFHFSNLTWNELSAYQ